MKPFTPPKRTPSTYDHLNFTWTIGDMDRITAMSMRLAGHVVAQQYSVSPKEMRDLFHRNGLNWREHSK